MATSAQAGTYTVRWGDTLSGIADRHHVSLTRLARINHIPAYGVLQTGRVLHVPGRTAAPPPPRGQAPPSPSPPRPASQTPPRPCAPPRAPAHLHAGIHTVRAGETLSLIAARYHSSVRILTRANRRRSGQLLLVGTRLLIPLRHRSHRHHAHHDRRRHSPRRSPPPPSGVPLRGRSRAPMGGRHDRSLGSQLLDRPAPGAGDRLAGIRLQPQAPSPRSAPVGCCR